MNLWHDPEKILVTYTKDSETKSFKCGMEKLDDLIAWANKEFGDASQPVRPNIHSISTAQNIAMHRARRKA